MDNYASKKDNYASKLIKMLEMVSYPSKWMIMHHKR